MCLHACLHACPKVRKFAATALLDPTTTRGAGAPLSASLLSCVARRAPAEVCAWAEEARKAGAFDPTSDELLRLVDDALACVAR